MPRRDERRTASVQELLPLEDVVDGVLCLRSGDYRAILEVQSINFALKSEGEQEAIIAGYGAFLNALSYPVQFVVRILLSDVEPYLASLRERAAGGADEALRRLALDHEAFVRRLARERTLLERRFYVVIPAGLDEPSQRHAIRWPWQQATSARQGLEAAARQLSYRCQEISEALGAFGVQARRLNSEELMQLWSAFLGKEAAAAPSGWARPRPVVTANRSRGANSGA